MDDGNDMTIRLILAIVSSLLEEVALVVVVLWGLPQIDVHIPLAGLVAMMVALGAYDIFSYRMGSKALRQRPVMGLPAMVGSRGKVAIPLSPEGMVKVKGELWKATSEGGVLDIGDEITVVGQDGLRLIVRKNTAGDLEKNS